VIRMKMNYWTDEEIKILRENHSKMPTRELQKTLLQGRTVMAINCKARMLGMNKPRKFYRFGNIPTPNKGKKFSAEWCKNISEGGKGHIPWNKDKKWDNPKLSEYWAKLDSVKREERIEQLREHGFQKGHTTWNKGVPMTAEAKKHLSDTRKGVIMSPNTLFKKGHIPWNKGLKVQTNTGRTHFKKGQVPLAVIRNSRKSCAERPSKPEERFMGICKDYDLPFEYTGDGSFWVDRMNPDFVDFNGKTIVEIFGRYWHDPTQRKVPERQTEGGRISAFNDAGWAAIVIWEDELNNPEIVINMINSVGEMR